AASVFNPDDVGVRNPISGTTVVYYPTAHAYTDSFNATTGSDVKGIAFPSGSRSVLFFGKRSSTTYCYGIGTSDPKEVGTTADCYDPCDSSKGGHGYPYYHRVWAYDANNLLDVKNGLKQSWEVTPYASFDLTEMDNSGCAGVRSAGYDP